LGVRTSILRRWRLGSIGNRRYDIKEKRGNQGAFCVGASYRRHGMTDAAWAAIELYTIGNKESWGGNARDARFINGIFWILRADFLRGA
jgi:hypothetical protein